MTSSCCVILCILAMVASGSHAARTDLRRVKENANAWRPSGVKVTAKEWYDQKVVDLATLEKESQDLVKLEKEKVDFLAKLEKEKVDLALFLRLEKAAEEEAAVADGHQARLKRRMDEMEQSKLEKQKQGKAPVTPVTHTMSTAAYVATENTNVCLPGSTKIADADACSVAAVALLGADAYKGEYGTIRHPSGCYEKDGEVRYNSHQGAARPHSKLICHRSQLPSSPPKGATIRSTPTVDDNLVDVTFSPMPLRLGVTFASPTSGEISKVTPGGQADQNHVQKGWTMVKLGGKTFSRKKLALAKEQSKDFRITFEKEAKRV